MTRISWWLAVVAVSFVGILNGSLPAQEKPEPDERPRPEGRASGEGERRRDAEAREGDAARQRQALEREIQELMRRAEELRKGGKSEEAAEVQKRAELLIQRTREGAASARDTVRRRIEELRKAGQAGQAEELERHLDELVQRERQARELAERERDREGRRDGEPEPRHPEELQRRMHHLRLAAENLEAAGFPERAEELRRNAEQLLGRHMPGPGPRPGPDMRAEFMEMHQHVRGLTERVERLEGVLRRLMVRFESDEGEKKGKDQ